MLFHVKSMKVKIDKKPEKSPNSIILGEQTEGGLPTPPSLASINKIGCFNRKSEKKTSIIDSFERIEEDEDSESEESKKKSDPSSKSNTNQSPKQSPLPISNENLNSPLEKSDFKFEGQVLAMAKKQQGSRFYS